MTQHNSLERRPSEAKIVRPPAPETLSISWNLKFHCRRMVSSGLLRRVALVRTDVSEEPGALHQGDKNR
jgi:hypothetical protein